VYDEWIHRRCGVYGRLWDVADFECATFKGNHIVEPRMEKIDVGDVTLECVDEFCYLGDVIGVGDGTETSSIMRVRCGWKKFRELLPLLTMKRLSLRMKGNLYAACVRSVML